MRLDGFTLKSVKKFKGHEGETCYQGNIYLNNKKVGYFSSDYNMGPMDVRFDDKETEKLFAETGKKFLEKYPKGYLYSHIGYEKLMQEYWNDESFISELLDIIEAEKMYKKAVKNGYKFLYVTFRKKDGNIVSYSSMKLIPKTAFKEKGEELFLFANSFDTFNLVL